MHKRLYALKLPKADSVPLFSSSVKNTLNYNFYIYWNPEVQRFLAGYAKQQADPSVKAVYYVVD